MKHQASITIDEKLMIKIKEKLRDGTFGNQSHLFEFAVKKLLEGNENDKTNL